MLMKGNRFWSDDLAQRNAAKANSAASSQAGPLLEAIFAQFAAVPGNHNDANAWGIDSTIAWCQALAVDPEDPVMLAVAELCNAKEMATFDKEGWVKGWRSLRITSIEGQAAHLDSLRTDLRSNPATFRKVYNFTFGYAKDSPATKVLALETAAPLWDLLLPLAPVSMFEPTSAWCFARDPDGAGRWLGRWKAFLESDRGGKNRPISKDVWMQVRSRPFTFLAL